MDFGASAKFAIVMRVGAFSPEIEARRPGNLRRSEKEFSGEPGIVTGSSS
jgi:hypothetical protein